LIFDYDLHYDTGIAYLCNEQNYIETTDEKGKESDFMKHYVYKHKHDPVHQEKKVDFLALSRYGRIKE